MKKELYVLYFLKIKKIRSFKIGITSYERKEARFKEIEKAFGKINKIHSFYFVSHSMKEIRNLEKAFHLIFWSSSKELKQNGSGHTEFFKESSFENASGLINFIKKFKKIKGPIYLINAGHRIGFYFIFVFTIIGISSLLYYLSLNHI